MTSAIAEVTSVPTTIDHASKMSRETFQSSFSAKPKTPKRAKAGWAFAIRKTKKKAISAGVGRVDSAQAEVARDREPVTGGRRRPQRRRDELPRLVLHVREREAVLQRVGLLDVPDAPLRLLDRRRDAVVALGARGALGPL